MVMEGIIVLEIIYVVINNNKNNNDRINGQSPLLGGAFTYDVVRNSAKNNR